MSVETHMTMGGAGLCDVATAEEQHRQPSWRSSSRSHVRAFGMSLVLIATFGLGLIAGVADGGLVDTDAYSWLNRTIDLRTDEQWFDDTIERINPPTGLQQHWSRPFDTLLLVGGLIGEPFVGFTTALFGWAVILPSLLGILTLWLAWWGFADLLDRGGRIALALLFGLQLTIAMGFMSGRPDHQALMGVLLVGIVAVCRRAFGATGGHRIAARAGILSGVALWVGMEAALLICGVTAAIGLQWVLIDDDSPARLRTYALALAGSATAALLLEHDVRGLIQTQLDELSVTLVVAALLLALACAALHVLRERLRSPWHRAAGLTVVGALSLMALALAFPEILTGPLGTVDPLYGRTRLPSIGELQPLFSRSVRKTVSLAIPGLSLLPMVGVYLVANIRRTTTVIASGVHLLLAPAVIYLPMAIGQQRWLLPLNLLLVVPAALGAQRAMRAVVPARPVGLGAISLAAIAALWWLPALAWSTTDAPARCDVDDAVTALHAAPRGSTVMAFTDFGPELLFRTTHAVLSIPNHRYQAGYTATYETMTTASATRARDIIDRSSTDLVLVCTDEVERSFYGDDPASFHARLATGTPPAWLHPMATPESAPRFWLYRVTS